MSPGRRRGLFAQRRGRRWGCLALLLPLAAAAALLLSLNGLSNRYARLETRRVTFVDLPRALERFRILHISDLHAASIGNAQENVLRALGREEYDAVVLSGDMVGRGGSDKPLMDLLRALGGKAPVFFV
ncbi:MAG TPA: metallophosphoesterase, partial [Candidatus Limnocylindria bacterium]|nr:metallophosphoesterase [Candidatus Limnocylindria bacterium]